MNGQQLFDVIIIGGSYAGLSAAMGLGRARRHVLIIDSGKPCNRQAPQAHNFITHDGVPPAVIAQKAKAQVLAYPTVVFVDDKALTATGTDGHFEITTESGRSFRSKKLLLAYGVKDIPTPIPGFEQCWGISVLHCPYCHGYEVRDAALGVIANGDMGFEYARLIANWSRNLALFTNGPSTLNEEQQDKLRAKGITVVEQAIAEIAHNAGHISALTFIDGTKHDLTAIFARGSIEQHSDIAAQLGCELRTDVMYAGLISVDGFGKTTTPGVYAAGDNTHPFRSVAMATGSGNMTGPVINHELIREEF